MNKMKILFKKRRRKEGGIRCKSEICVPDAEITAEHVFHLRRPIRLMIRLQQDASVQKTVTRLADDLSLVFFYSFLSAHLSLHSTAKLFILRQTQSEHRQESRFNVKII